MLQESSLWVIEGELLQATLAADKLSRKEKLTRDEEEKLADLEKRKEILSKRLRDARMRGL